MKRINFNGKVVELSVLKDLLDGLKPRIISDNYVEYCEMLDEIYHTQNISCIVEIAKTGYQIKSYQAIHLIIYNNGLNDYVACLL